MRTLAVLIAAAASLAACSASVGSADRARSHDRANCAIIAVVAKAQYDFSEFNPMPLDRDGYVPQCDWTLLALKVEIVDYENLKGPISPIVTFERPQRRGDQVAVVARFWNGAHLTTRICSLERTGEDWRLLEECPATAFY